MNNEVEIQEPEAVIQNAKDLVDCMKASNGGDELEVPVLMVALISSIVDLTKELKKHGEGTTYVGRVFEDFMGVMSADLGDLNAAIRDSK